METNNQSTFTTDVGRKILAGLNYLSADERYMQRVLKNVDRLVKEKRKEAAQEPGVYTLEELDALLERSEAEIEKGDLGVPSSEVFAELEKEFPFLCK